MDLTWGQGLYVLEEQKWIVTSPELSTHESTAHLFSIELWAQMYRATQTSPVATGSSLGLRFPQPCDYISREHKKARRKERTKGNRRRQPDKRLFVAQTQERDRTGSSSLFPQVDVWLQKHVTSSHLSQYFCLKHANMSTSYLPSITFW